MTRLALLSLFLTAGIASAQHPAPSTAESFEKDIRPLLKEYCLTCHSTEKQKGDLDLEQFDSMDQIKRHPKIWQGVLEQMGLGEMPPKDKPQLSNSENERFTKWVQNVLHDLALARAGDPGPVILRRLSNAEYTYTIQDLTGVPLEPAKEFPIDGAAGEGFMNTGNALVMSPALFTKYFDAGKAIANHAVLLPDGIRFSEKTTRRDWTDELVQQIKSFYSDYTDGEGKIPLERYLTALLKRRSELRDNRLSVLQIAREQKLNAKYLEALWRALEGKEPSLVLDGVRARWRDAKETDAALLTAQIGRWQKALWTFKNVGHIKTWQDPVNPISTKQEFRFKIPVAPGAKEVSLYLAASDAGDGNENDFIEWEQPKISAPGRPDLLLRDLRTISHGLERKRQQLFSQTAQALMAAAEAASRDKAIDRDALAQKHQVEPATLNAWFDYLGTDSDGTRKIESHFTNKLTNVSNYDFVKGWGSPDTPSLVANSSDQHVRIPGNMKPRSVAVHPSPKLQAAVGWQSPSAQVVRVEARITPAHPECGNGVTWSLELRRGITRQRLASGIAAGGRESAAGPFENLALQSGDLLSLLIGPRDGNHACDLTEVNLVVRSAGASGREWNLAADITNDVLASNPHPDSFGNSGVWHFYTELDKGGSGTTIPGGSLLARWQSAAGEEEKRQLAQSLQQLLITGPSDDKDTPDRQLYRLLISYAGPLLNGVINEPPGTRAGSNELTSPNNAWGIDPGSFGKTPGGASIPAANLCLQAPSLIEVRLPASLIDGCEFVTTARLHSQSGSLGSIQAQVLTNQPPTELTVRPDLSIIVGNKGSKRQKVETAFEAFREIFPAAICYMRIVPVDEVITLTQFHREDQHLVRLMLNDQEAARLDRLWDELRYISQDALTIVDAYAQLMEYATQDSDPKLFEHLRKPIHEQAAALQKRFIDTEPKHFEALIKFTAQAYRRPLTSTETSELQTLYATLRSRDLPHDEAFRMTLARVLTSPAFLYRLENAPSGKEPAPVSNWELANRLSYFLWSSMPDAELRSLAAAGRLSDPAILAAQATRMLQDYRTRRLAIEFGCQWLHVHSFDALDEKSERHFPDFNKLKGAMYEESIHFFTDLFRQDRSVFNILDADYTFLNESLARHYGIPNVAGPDWKRVDGVKKFSRGGVLAQATTLAKHSGASRTSPILRGNWVSEVLLGEKLPRPPKDVPQLPEDESATEGLTVRQLVEKHSSDPKCAGCHARMDPYGYALESFDAIGRWREKDLGDRPIDTYAKIADGTEVDGVAGLRNYLLTTRREAFARQFCRKLLGYALGRAVLLSDEPLLAEMRSNLKANGDRVSAAVETIVKSRQFREIRGREASHED